ncbi:MAG: VTT domain-containing protein [Acidobacteriota bacterium]|jgi:membrane protein DedA with SNARE-associated domain
MNEMAHFLAQHGYWLVFGWVFTEQIGLPVPSTIVLVAAGTLAGRGVLSLPVVIWVGIAAALITDVIWYRIGRAKGLGVLSFLCRISLEPDSCVRRAEEAFARNRTRTLLIAKFVPGLSLAAPPLAGMFGMSFFRFLMLDLLGSLLWVGSFCGLGYVFSHQFERLYLWIRRFGIGLGLLIVLVVAGYLGWKYLQRRHFIRQLRVATISAEEVLERMKAGEPLFIVDVRHGLDLAANPVRLPGALQIEPEELARRHREVPRDREIILYCT